MVLFAGTATIIAIVLLNRWPLNRLLALLLTIVLAGLAIYAWLVGPRDRRALWLLAVGVILGLVYTIRGGSLPPFVHRISGSHWAGGNAITEDDDPRNLSPKIYLPILLLVVLAAAALVWNYAKQH